MEKDTILLDLKTYNELRDFQKGIEDGHTYRIGFGRWGTTHVFIGTDEALKEMGEQLKEIQEENYELKNPDEKQPSIDELKSMSWWKFRKWKAGNL